MSVVCYYSYSYLYAVYEAQTLLGKLLEAFVPILLGGLTFVIVAKILRVGELEQFFGIFRSKFGSA